jgi:hypothetical protein
MSITIGDCPFCGAIGVPINDEHAYPDWIIRLVQGRRGVGRNSTKKLLYRLSHGTEVVREYRTRDPETIVKAPCGDRCNGGWMHDLEDAVIPFLRPMIVGEPTFVDRPRGTRLALWAVKTAMTHEFIDVGGRRSYRYFTDVDRLAVRNGMFPERTIRLWAVRASSPRALAFEATPMRMNSSSQTSFLTHAATMFIDNLALQLLVHPIGMDINGLPTTEGPWDRLVPLFPHDSTEPFLWPPVFEELYDEDL